MKVVIDSNIWISFLIGKQLDRLLYLLTDKIEVLTSHVQMEEIIRVIERPKFEKYFSQPQKEFLIHFIERKAKVVHISHNVTACRDEKDNYLLELALSGEANVIVTGDKDLLILNPFEDIEIIGYQEFRELLSNSFST